MNIIEKIKEIFQKMPKKLRRGLAIGGTIAATAGLAASCGTEKDSQDANNIKVEQENNFREQLKHEVEKDANQAVEQSNVEKASQLKTAEEVYEFLKDLYIEQYEKETGDTTRTTENIEFKNKTNQDHVFVNQQTGEIITHGETPDEVKQKLKEDGISYDIKHNVDIYQVVEINEKGEEVKGLDAITVQSKDGETVPVKVILGDQYGNKEDTSILAEMGSVIPCGLEYADYLKKGNENDIAVGRSRLIKSVEKFENTKQNQNATEEKTEENPEEGLEHE